MTNFLHRRSIDSRASRRRNGAVAALLFAILLSSCAKKDEKESEAPAPVQVTAVTQDTVRRTVAGDGVLFPKDQSSVMPKISAPVQKFYVNRGDHVKAGQLVAVLENRDLTATANEAKGAFDQAEANLRMTQGANVPEAVVKAQTDVTSAREAADAAKRVLDSRTELFKQGALARRQVEEAQVNYAKARGDLLADEEHLRALQSVGKEEQVKVAAAQVESAKSHEANAQAQLSYTRILSPKTGIIADRPLYEGDMASPTVAPLTVLDISHAVARVHARRARRAWERRARSSTGGRWVGGWKEGRQSRRASPARVWRVPTGWFGVRVP